MLRYRMIALALAASASVVLIGCATGGGLSRQSPVQPLPVYENQYADIVVDTSTKPEPTIELTKDLVTVRVQFWRKYELDRKFNRGTSTSPFLTEPTWKQGDTCEVFFVTIKNGRKAPLSVKLRDFVIEDNLKLREDMDGNLFLALSADDNEKRILYKKGQNIAITNGLNSIKPQLLETNMPNGEIAPGATAEGWVPFFGFKMNATRLMLRIGVDAAPEESAISRYKRIDFEFPLALDRSIYEAQPATLKY